MGAVKPFPESLLAVLSLRQTLDSLLGLSLMNDQGRRWMARAIR